jgi:hypothetical protein
MSTSFSGRAKTVIVFQRGQTAEAVVSSVIASVRTNAGKDRLRFTGVVGFEPKTREHIREIILPLVEQILRHLNLEPDGYDLSVVNFGAASAAEVPPTITGFSADVPVFIAFLSASLGLEAREDLLSTGHIASPDGDIALVKNIAAKLHAAVLDQSIQYFIYPSIEGDISLDVLTRHEKQEVADALAKMKHNIRAVGVHNVRELLETALSDEAIVLASLRKGFFEVSLPAESCTDAIGRAVAFLCANNERRLWSCLERRLIAGENKQAKTLLSAWSEYSKSRQKYPKAFGLHLHHLVASLPPSVRRLKTTFPLLPTGVCIALSQFASDADHEDVTLLFEAAAGRGINRRADMGTDPTDSSKPNRTGDNPDAVLDLILSEMDAETLTREISLAIDTARATYMMNSVTVDAHEELLDIVSSFHLHLLRHTGSIAGPADPKSAASDALDLVEKAFHEKGGWKAALAEARTAAHGGLRLILDTLTDYWKSEQIRRRMGMLFLEALAPYDSEFRVAIVRSFLTRIAPHLSEDIRERSPYEYEQHIDVILAAYVRAMESLKNMFRRL